MGKGKKMNLGEFLGPQGATYIPEETLPSGPRPAPVEDQGHGGRREREPLRSEMSTSWRGDRGPAAPMGREREPAGGSWRSGPRGDSNGPSRPGGWNEEFVAEERPAHMRLNLQRRSQPVDSAGPSEGRSGGDKFASAFGGRSQAPRGAPANRFTDLEKPSDDVRKADASLNSKMEKMEVQEKPMDKKKKAKEEKKQKAREEQEAKEAAKREAAEAKKRAQEEKAKQDIVDREIMSKVLATGLKGEELSAKAKSIFEEEGRTPAGDVLVESVAKQAEDVAQKSANWIALSSYGELLKLVLEDAEVEQVRALNALQVFLHGHDFPKGLLEKCFMALYTQDIVEEPAFIEYKYDVDSQVPGRMKAIVQTSNWLTWLETPEESSDEEEDE